MTHRPSPPSPERDPSTPLPEDFFQAVDRHFARFMTRLSGRDDPALLLAAALVSRLSREGHTCLDLNSPPVLTDGDDPASALDLPSPGTWIEALTATPVVGGPGDYSPLILDDAGRLYLHRSFKDERSLAEGLLRLNAENRPFDEGLLRESLARLFPGGDPARKVAAVIAASKSLCVITGGPGTGKTTLVAGILSLLLEHEPGLKVVLAAPTGKAARRIEESISRGLDLLGIASGLAGRIPREALTIHRLMGIIPASNRPRHHAGNPLPADVAVVDEASMADLALTARLVQALKPGARLILLGDRNQLASVAAGYVLGDICDTGTSHAYSREFATLVERTAGCPIPAGDAPGMQDSLAELSTTYRFTPESPIHRLSVEVNRGNAPAALDILHDSTGPELLWSDLPGAAELRGRAGSAVLQGYGPYLEAGDAGEALDRFGGFRILCPVREGPCGVEAMNRLAEGILRDAGLVDPSGQHYHGRPVLITENDYALRLFNGDTGIVLRSGDGELRACFRDRGGAVRMLSPRRLPGHETAWAMTVHKSQGSEFGSVLLILPRRDSPVLTRELVYTGITRARDSLEIWSGEGIFIQAVSRRTERTSGLNDLLWGRKA